MADDFQTARNYLAPDQDSFWQWSDDAEAIYWAHGTTIVFRGELEIVLERLAAGGLPPMDALVLLLAACRDPWGEASRELGTTAGLLASVQRRDLPGWLPELFAKLDAVNALPEERRKGPYAKAVLAEVVFEACPRRRPAAESPGVLRALGDVPPPEMLTPCREASAGYDRFVAHLRALHEGLQKVDAESLELRLQTGLDRLVEPAEIELPPAERVRRLVGELQDDPELGGVARLARHLMAAASLPRPMARHDDLPVGGVSGIANRGPLDRLLLSELAYDNLTLAVRVAVNEAMYLRRESPPQNPPRCRALLIDAGIRLWGVPRVFATAVALALAATGDRRADVAAFRPQGDRVVPVDLTSRKGLVEHLAVLRPEAHPGDALPAFLSAADESGEPADAVLITGEDVLDDRRFERAIQSPDVSPLVVATVDRDGRFRIQLRTARGSKPLREARLDLDKLVKPRVKPTTPLIDRRREGTLPAIFGVTPFPLLLSYQPIDPQRTWCAGWRGVLAITKDRRLMLWERRARGARQLADDLPVGKLLWAMPSPTNHELTQAIIAATHSPDVFLLSIGLPTDDCHRMRLETGEHPPTAAWMHHGMLFLAYTSRQGEGRVDVLETSTGRRIASAAIPYGTYHERDRYFFRQRRVDDARIAFGWDTNREWSAMAYDGATPSLEKVPLVGLPEGQPPLTVFERYDPPQTVVVTNAGHLYFPAEERFQQVEHGLRDEIKLVAVSRDGNHLVYSDYGWHNLTLVDVAQGTSQRVGGVPWPIVEPRIAATADPMTTWHRFLRIRAQQGCLVLESRKGRLGCIVLHNRDLLLKAITESDSYAKSEDWRTFRLVEGPPETGYTLGVATWDDGSRAFLDSRGLLHLISSDANLPEATLVLNEGAMAGWCSDGRIFGHPYFVGDTANARPDEVYRDVIGAFVRRLT